MTNPPSIEALVEAGRRAIDQEPTGDGGAIDPNSDISAIRRCQHRAITAPLSDDFAADIERVCNLALDKSAKPPVDEPRLTPEGRASLDATISRTIAAMKEQGK